MYKFIPLFYYFKNKIYIKVRRIYRDINFVRKHREYFMERWYGCRWEEAEPSNSGKRAWRCICCGRWSVAPIRAIYDPCPEKVIDLFDEESPVEERRIS